MTELRRAEYSDVPQIMEIMSEAHNSMLRSEDYMTDDVVYVSDHISRRGFILLSEIDAQIAGFFMVHLPGNGMGNLGEYLEFTEEQLRRTAVMDSVAVRPCFQGLGLMRQLLDTAVSILPESYNCFLGTVAPTNMPSLCSFQNCNFHICKEIVNSQGFQRLLMGRFHR